MRYRWISAVLLVGGIVALVGGPAHAATVTLTITPSSGVTTGQSVTVTASGLTPNSIGNLLECNSDANQPTVALGAPINTKVSVGCSAPSYSKLVTVNGSGAISATWTVTGPTVGPPCGPASGNIITTCPATDSAGNSPTADAALYPCPPTPAQQAAGDVCQLNYGDAANDSGTGNIGFAQSAPPSTTPSTSGSTPGSTSATSGTTGTSAAPATSSGSSGSGGASSGGSGSSASGSSGSSASSASAPTAASSSGTLASTGPPAWLWTVLAAGLGCLGLGGLLFLDPALGWRRKAVPEGAYRAPSPSSASARNDLWITNDLWVREP